MSKIINFDELKNKKIKKIYIVYFIFFIIVLYVFYSIYLLTNTPKETTRIEKGVVSLEESANGYIIRDEEVFKGENYKNKLTAIVAEGERAAKGQNIFRYSSGNEENIKDEIDDINVKIQEALSEQTPLFTTDIKNLERQLDEKIEAIQCINDVHTISEYKKEIEEIIEKKAKIVGSQSSAGSYIQELNKQKETLEKKLMDGSEYIKTDKSGVVSYKVDGLEDVLTPNDFSNLTEAKLNNLELKTGKIISTSNECGKIIDNFNCYLATILNSEIALKSEVGDKVEIFLSGGMEITSKIVYISKQDDDKVLIVFELNTLTEELVNYRKISFNITWWSYSGLKVPNSSIIEKEDGLKYVVREKAGENQDILIKLLKRNDKYSIIGTYNNDELQGLNVDIKKYNKIAQYDTILLYPIKK